eukprot:30118-Pelagococcus_subviridis.AAC.1
MYLSSSACRFTMPSGCVAASHAIRPPSSVFSSVSSSAVSHHRTQSTYKPFEYAYSAFLCRRDASSVNPRMRCAFSSSFARTLSLYALCAGDKSSSDSTPSAFAMTSDGSRSFSMASAYCFVARSTARLFAPNGTRSLVSSAEPRTTDAPPRMLSPNACVSSVAAYCARTRSSGDKTGVSDDVSVDDDDDDDDASASAAAARRAARAAR